jgi:ligand-binding SRPBCC domain-containing protein
MRTVSVERIINAPLEKVWEVAANFGESPGPSIEITVEKEGDPNFNGLGMERTIHFLKQKAKVHERLESYDPPNSFSYSIISGAPVKSYIGEALFSTTGDATKVKWSGTFAPKIPGSGWLIGIMALKNINNFLDELEKIK